MEKTGIGQERIQIHLIESAINDLVGQFENSKAPTEMLKLADKLQLAVDKKYGSREGEHKSENRTVIDCVK